MPLILRFTPLETMRKVCSQPIQKFLTEGLRPLMCTLQDLPAQVLSDCLWGVLLLELFLQITLLHEV